MNSPHQANELFERRISYPDVEAKERLNRLIGLDNYKNRLMKMLSLLINRKRLNNWIEKHHPEAEEAEYFIDMVLRCSPLIILSGDVGSGKTELAETIGDAVARQENIDITLMPLSLSSRGQGRVGEMTQLISTAFNHAVTEAQKLKSLNGTCRAGIILLIDEADALVQSRELAQMHHEDKAGVNAFIRGVDRIGNSQLPAAIIMCTNRLNALDPAIKRRAADILNFSRPNPEQRSDVLSTYLLQLGFTQAQVDSLVEITGPTADRKYGFTFSDLTQRLLPTIFLDAYPNQPVTPEQAIKIAETIEPTRPFQEDI